MKYVFWVLLIVIIGLLSYWMIKNIIAIIKEIRKRIKEKKEKKS